MVDKIIKRSKGYIGGNPAPSKKELPKKTDQENHN